MFELANLWLIFIAHVHALVHTNQKGMKELVQMLGRYWPKKKEKRKQIKAMFGLVEKKERQTRKSHKCKPELKME